MLIETLKENSVEYSYEILKFPEIINFANHVLHPVGTLAFEETSNFCYLKISDKYIFDTYHFLHNKNLKIPINIPDYFTERKNRIGAHITLVYPEEPNAILIKQNIQSQKSLNTFSFSVQDLLSVNVFNKTLVVLTVTCPELDQIRKVFGLPPKLNYNGLLVPFHITIATSKT